MNDLIAESRPVTDARILIIHPDASARSRIRLLLTDAGYGGVLEAKTGSEALKHLRRGPVAAIVSDIEFPELDIWRLARLVRSGVLPSPETTPVVIVASTWCERIAETTAREFGINALLPMERLEQLPEVLKTQLEGESRLFQRTRVLVIEDYPDTLNLAKRVLESRFEVSLAEDGEQGWLRWQAERHELVLLDVMLPRMSGPEVLDRILAADPGQPVVIMTAHSTLELAEDLMTRGAADFVMKPFRAEELRRVCEIAARREDYLVSNRQFAEKVRSLEASRADYRLISETHQQLLDSLRTVVVELDQEGGLEFLNRAWEGFTGHSVSRSLGRQLSDFAAADLGNLDNLRRYLHALSQGELREARFEVELRHAEGHPIWAGGEFHVGHNAEGRRLITGTLEDISGRKQAEREVERLRLFDHLTGLYNRQFFDRRLAELAERARAWGESHALLYIDLDHFKVINDAAGHQQGDVVLQEMARLLARRLRPDDVLCRVGGDEFAILLVRAGRRQAESLAEALAEQVKHHPCRIGDQVFPLACSIGISLVDGSQPQASDYLKQADIAVFVAKQRGRSRFHVYDPRDRDSEELRQSVEWARRLRRALEEGALELYFQPVVALADGHVAYHEALARIRIPERGLLSPEGFIPALERSGEMLTLDEAVMTAVIETLRRRPELTRIAVNLSAQSFADPRLAERIEARLAGAGVHPSRLSFELTETASLRDVDACREQLGRLAALGCRCAIDDFGSGFASFAYLKTLPADTLKLDMSFIQNLEQSPVDQALVRAIREVAQALGKHTVAEGVEQAATLNLLRELGIDYAQGFFLGAPAPLDVAPSGT